MHEQSWKQGPPWVIRHVATDMIEYVVLEMEFDCSEAIDGATVAAKRCPMMGPQWVIRRAQKKGEAQVDDTGGAKGSNGNKVHDKVGEGIGAADPHAETPEKKGC